MSSLSQLSPYDRRRDTSKGLSRHKLLEGMKFTLKCNKPPQREPRSPKGVSLPSKPEVANWCSMDHWWSMRSEKLVTTALNCTQELPKAQTDAQKTLRKTDPNHQRHHSFNQKSLENFISHIQSTSKKSNSYRLSFQNRSLIQSFLITSIGPPSSSSLPSLPCITVMAYQLISPFPSLKTTSPSAQWPQLWWTKSHQVTPLLRTLQCSSSF